MDDTNIIVHILLVFPFSQRLAGKFLFLELFDDRVIMLVPGGFLFRSHPVVHITSGFFQSRIGVDLVFFVCQFQVIHQIHVFNDTHFLLRSGNTAFIFVVESFRYRENNILIQFQITGIRHPGTVRSLMMQEQAERFVLIPFLVHPVDSQIGCYIGGVSFYLFLFSVIDKIRIVIIALSYQYVPVIEPGRFGCQVPFTDNSGLVTGLLQ